MTKAEARAWQSHKRFASLHRPNVTSRRSAKHTSVGKLGFKGTRIITGALEHCLNKPGYINH